MSDDRERRESIVVRMREEGHTLRAIGAALNGLSAERVRQIWLRHERRRTERESMEAREDYRAAIRARTAGLPIPDSVRLDVVAYLVGIPRHDRTVMWLSDPYKYRFERGGNQLDPIITAGDLRRVSVTNIARRYPNIGRRCLLPFMSALGIPAPTAWNEPKS